MADEERHEPRPLWVRVVARDRTKRTGALAQVSAFGLIACIGLLTVVIKSPSSSLLGAIALPFGLVGGCLGVIGAIWTWFAVRWVDRNGKWA